MNEFTEDKARLIVWEEINNKFVDEKSCKERHQGVKGIIDELKIVVDKQSKKLDRIIILLIAGCIGLIFDLIFRFVVR